MEIYELFIGLRKTSKKEKVDIFDIDTKEIIEKALKLRSHKNTSLNDFKLNESQIKLYDFIGENNLSIIRKERQVGVTSLLCAIAACKIVKGGNVFLYMEGGGSLSRLFIKTVRHFIKQIDEHYSLSLTQQVFNNDKIVLSESGGSLTRINYSEHHSFTGKIKNDDWVIFDEAAFYNKGSNAWLVSALIDTKCKVTISSTHKYDDGFFMPLYLISSKYGFSSGYINKGTREEGQSGNLIVDMYNKYGDSYMDVIYESINKFKCGEKISLKEFFEIFNKTAFNEYNI